MTWRALAGLLCIAAPFAIIFALVAGSSGYTVAFKTFGLAFGLIAVTALGVYLLLGACDRL